MTAILILSWIGLVIVSYQGAIMMLKKSGSL
jgi:hypothetical protein